MITRVAALFETYHSEFRNSDFSTFSAAWLYLEAEVAPTEASMLEEFIKKCKDCFSGSMLTAWRRLLDPMNRGQIYRPESARDVLCTGLD